MELFNKMEYYCKKCDLIEVEENMKGFDLTELSVFSNVAKQFFNEADEEINVLLQMREHFTCQDNSVSVSIYKEIDNKMYANLSVLVVGKLYGGKVSSANIAFTPFNCFIQTEEGKKLNCAELTKIWRIVLKTNFPEWETAFKQYALIKKNKADKENEKNLQKYKETEEKINNEFNQDMYLANL